MKAIRTRYVGPTNTRGSRIVATDADGNKVSISYPSAYSSETAHEIAAYLLMEKMGWPNALIGGGFKNDNYWVMLPREDRSAESVHTQFLAAYKAAR